MFRPQNLDTDVYLRKSRKDVEEEKKAAERGETYDTLARHRKQLLAIAKRDGHNILDIHEELVSGESVLERPKIQKLIRRIEAGEIEAVLVIDIDRLGRGDMLDQGILDRAFRYSGTKLLTTTEYYDPEDESWELVFGIKSLVARQELKAITRRLQGGRRNSVSEGKSISKKPPYGYLRNENLKLFPDPDTAWVVKKIFTLMREGHGRQYIAHELDRLGIKPPNEKREFWSPSTITAIVKNEVYIGTLIWGKVKYVKKGGEYARKKVPRDQWIIIENSHEPIVSIELFEIANRSHTGRHRPSTELSKTLSNPLAGILKCEICGYTMWLQPKKDRPNGMIRCATPTCRGVQKGALFPLVENRVIQGLKELVQELEMIVDKPVGNLDIKDKENVILNMKKEITDLSTQKRTLHDLLERGVYDIDTFIERQNDISERTKKKEEEVRQLEIEIDYDQKKNSVLHDFSPSAKKVLQAYEDSDSEEEKNKLLKTVLEKATYLRKQEWKKKDEFVIQLYPKI